MMKKEEGRLVRVDRVPMRWGEMDALGHMNNVSYFRYFEQARISWFDSLKIDYSPDSEGPILGTISCKFVRPAIYPADLEITTYVGNPGRSSFMMFHEMVLAGDPATLYAEAGAVMVWIGIGDGKSRPLPDWIRKKLTNSPTTPTSLRPSTPQGGTEKSPPDLTPPLSTSREGGKVKMRRR